jgi:hypothetical protein
VVERYASKAAPLTTGRSAKEMKTRKSIWLLLIGTLALVGVAMLFVDVIPPRSMTHTSMHMCKRRVLRYAHKHGKLPSALGETDVIEGFHESLKDGWGIELEYSVDADDVVTFQSLGKDHNPGGVGDSADMIGIFPARRRDGSWYDEAVEWKQDPYEQFRNR